MHELWVCRNIFDIVMEHARKEKCARVKVIYLEIGVLAAIDKSALLFSFEVITKGTIAENAILKFIDIGGIAWCEGCQIETPLHRFGEVCCQCGKFLNDIKAGKELRIKTMEVE